VTVNSLHPGIIRTNLLNQSPWIFKAIFGLMSGSPAKGAATSIYLASSPDVKGISGQFFVNCKAVPTTDEADDPETAKRLWDVSMTLISS
jgi:hypothetical protein